MQQHILEKLEEFGLSEKEAKVYLASLELGKATADKLSKHSGVNRSTTYVQIEELTRLGLMSHHEEKKKTFFIAESPDNLKRLIEKKEEELVQKTNALDNFVPELQRIFDTAGERPVVRFFEGKDGVKTMRQEVLKTKSKQILYATSFDDLWATFTWKELEEFSYGRAKKNIKSLILYTKTVDDVKPVQPSELRRVSKDKYPFECDIYVFDNKVAMASLKGSLVGVIIESKALAKSMQSIFMLAWEAAKPTSDTEK